MSVADETILLDIQFLLLGNLPYKLKIMGRARFYVEFLNAFGNIPMDARVHAFCNFDLKRSEKIQIIGLFRGFDRQFSRNLTRGDNPMEYPLLEAFKNSEVGLVSSGRFRGLQSLIVLDFLRFVREIRPTRPRSFTAVTAYAFRRGWTAEDFFSWTLTCVLFCNFRNRKI